MFAFIDDWGTPSVNQNTTDWFGFAGIFIKENEIEQLRLFYKNVCETLGSSPDSPIHSVNLGLKRKYFISKLLAQQPLTVCIVAVRVQAISSQQLRQRGWAYRYYAKEIIKSATHFAFDNSEIPNIIFHRHAYLEDINQYINQRLRHNSWYQNKSDLEKILYHNLSEISVLDDEDEVLLCLADCIANSCSIAFNPDRIWHLTNPTCLNLFSTCIYKGPSYNMNPRAFGAQLEPNGIITDLIPELPESIRVYWE